MLWGTSNIPADTVYWVRLTAHQYASAAEPSA